MNFKKTETTYYMSKFQRADQESKRVGQEKPKQLPETQAETARIGSRSKDAACKPGGGGTCL